MEYVLHAYCSILGLLLSFILVVSHFVLKINHNISIDLNYLLYAKFLPLKLLIFFTAYTQILCKLELYYEVRKSLFKKYDKWARRFYAEYNEYSFAN